jgi:hypothetical protein
MSFRAVLPLAVVTCLSAHLEANEKKMLLTDFCNRHTTRAPMDRPISERGAFAVTDRYRASLRPTVRWTSAPLAIPAPCYLAATRPRIDVHLTAHIELWLRRSQPRSISGQGRAPLRVALPCRGFFDRGQGWLRTPLTLPVAPREHSETRASSRNQDRFYRPRVNADGLTRPRAPSIGNVLPRDFAFAKTR